MPQQLYKLTVAYHQLRRAAPDGRQSSPAHRGRRPWGRDPHAPLRRGRPYHNPLHRQLPAGHQGGGALLLGALAAAQLGRRSRCRRGAIGVWADRGGRGWGEERRPGDPCAGMREGMSVVEVGVRVEPGSKGGEEHPRGKQHQHRGAAGGAHTGCSQHTAREHSRHPPRHPRSACPAPAPPPRLRPWLNSHPCTQVQPPLNQPRCTQLHPCWPPSTDCN